MWSPGLTVVTSVANRLDDPGALMAEHNRPVEREPPLPVDDMQIAVTHPGRRGADQHLAAPRLVDVDRFDGQRLVHLAKDRGVDLHFRPPEHSKTRLSVARGSPPGEVCKGTSAQQSID